MGEITSRGYEAFIVGGTVRDVINGVPSNDVDLVTSMPLARMFPLITSMYGGPRELQEIAKRNGHLRPGGRPGSGDPYIDLSVFKRSFIGTMNAIFGDDFNFDVKNRDFACNSLYYDPINKVLVDPTGYGISDTEQRLLRLVTDFDLRDPRQLARVFIRAVKFTCRGYVLVDECKEQTILLAQYLPSIDSMVRANYIKAQIISAKGLGGITAQAMFEEFRTRFLTLAPPELWDQFIEPIKERILL